MARARYQQKCGLCKKSWVQMFSTKQFPVCAPCQMKRLESSIEDPEFQQLFDLPRGFYEQSHFLRDIKEKYLRFGSLTDKQKEAFKKVAEEMKKAKTTS